ALARPAPHKTDLLRCYFVDSNVDFLTATPKESHKLRMILSSCSPRFEPTQTAFKGRPEPILRGYSIYVRFSFSTQNGTGIFFRKLLKFYIPSPAQMSLAYIPDSHK